MYGYIYKTTDLKTNKFYIGKHRATEFEGISYVGSGKIIKAIKKQCRQNGIKIEERLSVEMLCSADSLEELNEKEKFYIESLNGRNRLLGYNIAVGGDGGETTSGYIKITDGVKDTCIPKETPIPDGWRKGTTQCGSNNWNFGKHFMFINNSIHEKRIVAGEEIPDGYVRGRLLNLNQETRDRISHYKKTHKTPISNEARERLIENWRGENNPSVKHKKFGDENPFYGKHHSSEAIEQNREKHKIKYKCPFCDYVSNRSVVTRHIKKTHTDLMESASTIESITYEKYIGE